MGPPKNGYQRSFENGKNMVGIVFHSDETETVDVWTVDDYIEIEIGVPSDEVDGTGVTSVKHKITIVA